MEDRLTGAFADIDDHPIVLEARVAGGVGDELEHSLRFIRVELAHLTEAWHVPLRNHEQVDVRARVDVVDRDEAVCLADAVALTHEPAEEAVVRQRGSPPPRPAPRGRERARRSERRPAMANSRLRSRAQGDRRARDPRYRASSAS